MGHAKLGNGRETGAARIALALTAYHAQHRRYPETLAGLAAEGWDLPNDPFNGQPSIYRLEGDGFIIYSGQPRPEGRRRPPAALEGDR